MNCGLYLPLVHRRRSPVPFTYNVFSPAFRKNRRPACKVKAEVELKSTSQACRRQRPAMVVVADGVCSHMSEQYPSAVPAAVSQVVRRHMRTRLKAGVHLKAVFTPPKIGLAEISRSRFK